MNLPSLLHHIFNPDSRKVGFGYQVFIWSTYGCFFTRYGLDHKPVIDADTWLLCIAISGTLIGGGTLADTFINARFGGKAAAAPPQGDANAPAKNSVGDPSANPPK